MLKVKLRIDDEEKTFLSDFVSALHYRKAVELNLAIRNGEITGEIETYDRIVDLIVSAFDKQFTVEQFNNGVKYDKYDEECRRIFHTLLGIEKTANEETEDEEVGKS